MAARGRPDHGSAATKHDPPPPPPVEYPGMVRIPAGPVQIGNDETELRLHYRSPKLKETTANVPIDNFLKFTTYPPHKEQVKAFWIDKYEVTNAEYAKFVKETAHPAPKHWEGGSPPEKKLQHPVTGVSYLDATAYAIWAKKKLPNQQQWLRAFRGDKDWFYPWGNEWEPNRAVVWDNNAFDSIAAVTATPNDVSPFGVLNMAGNASEMTRDPVTRNGAEVVFVRGASGARSDALQCMASSYAWQTTTSSDGWTGFRCVIEEP
jgi:iron(II)-dependent oxidoreductase